MNIFAKDTDVLIVPSGIETSSIALFAFAAAGINCT